MRRFHLVLQSDAQDIKVEGFAEVTGNSSASASFSLFHDNRSALARERRRSCGALVSVIAGTCLMCTFGCAPRGAPR